MNALDRMRAAEDPRDPETALDAPDTDPWPEADALTTWHKQFDLLRTQTLGDVLDHCPDDLAGPVWDAVADIATALTNEHNRRIKTTSTTDTEQRHERPRTD